MAPEISPNHSTLHGVRAGRGAAAAILASGWSQAEPGDAAWGLGRHGTGLGAAGRRGAAASRGAARERQQAVVLHQAEARRRSKEAGSGSGWWCGYSRVLCRGRSNSCLAGS